MHLNQAISTHHIHLLAHHFRARLGKTSPIAATPRSAIRCLSATKETTRLTSAWITQGVLPAVNPPSVVLDLRSNSRAGVFRYGLSVLPELMAQLTRAGLRPVVITTRRDLDIIGDTLGRHGVPASNVRATPTALTFTRCDPWLRSFVTDLRPAVYFSTNYLVDPSIPAPLVLTIHDLTRVKHPELSYTYQTFQERFPGESLCAPRESGRPHQVLGVDRFAADFLGLTRQLADRAERIVTVSASSMRDIRELLEVPPAKLVLAPCGIDSRVFHPRDEQASSRVRSRYRIDRPYLLAVGQAQPHKRLPWLIEQLCRSPLLRQLGHLVIVGGFAQRSAEVHQAVANCGAQRSVLLLGRVTDDELAGLYSGAAAYVTASVSEGSGLPAQEALACGCPVIATDISAARELLGGGAEYYAPEDGDLIRSLATRALCGRLRPPRPTRPAAWSHAAEVIAAMLTRTAATRLRDPEHWA